MTTETENGSALAETLVQRIGKTVGDRAQAATIFGKPVEREGITIVPVAKARFGFGGGGGGGTRAGADGSGGGGGGGGALVSPVGYIEIHDGAARFRRITRPTDLVPLVLAASLAALALKRLLG